MEASSQLVFPPFCFDVAAEQLRLGETPIPLRRQTLAVLRYLIEHAGQVVTKQSLLQALWPGVYVTDVAPMICINELRKALGDTVKHPRFIETVHRRGYRFIAAVTTTPPVPSFRSQVPSSGTQDSALKTQPSVLVGRELELSQLHSWWEKALNAERQVVFVTGEPGIGKTTVVEVFLSGVRKQRTGDSSPIPTDPRSLIPVPWISRGQCIEHYGAGEAYMPVLEALGRLCKEPGGERLVTLLYQHAPTWLVQMPSLLPPLEREQLQREVHSATRERMLREMAETLEALTAERPLILWLEDLHWSDISTLELLSVLARRPERARLLVIGTYRPVEMLAHNHPLRAIKQELHAHGQCKEIRLGLLTEASVSDYLTMQSTIGVIDQASLRLWAKAIHQRTEGNPLFMVNMVDYLLTEKKLQIVADIRQVTPLSSFGEILNVVPTSLRSMIERQLDRLSAEEQRLLEVASVVGVQFSTAAASEGLGKALSEVETDYAKLARDEQFIRPAGVSAWPDGTIATSYAFLHALYQDVLYERMPAGQRVTLHKQIAQREERAYGDQAREIAAELAVHFERGREYPWAVQYLRYAGENANQRSAHQEAIALLMKGLELLRLLSDVSERAEQELALQIALGPALVATQGYAAPEVERVYTRARALCQVVGESPQLFRALRGLWVLYLVQAKLPTAQELGEQLLHLAHKAQDSALLLEAHRPLGTTLFHRGELIPGRIHLEQSIALYDPRRHGSHAFLYAQDPGVVSHIYASLTLWFLGYPHQALQEIQKTLILAEETSHPFSRAWALFFSAVVYQLRREEQTVQQQTEEVIALCTAHAFPYWLAKGTILHGRALAEQGRQEDGIRQIDQGLVAHRATGSELWRSYYFALLAEAYGKAGRPEEGLTCVAEGLNFVEKTGERFYESELHRLRGELILLRSRVQCGKLKMANEAA